MSRVPFALLCAFSIATFVGCETPANALDPAQILGRDHVIGEPGPIPSGHDSSPDPVPGPKPSIGESCHSSDPKHVCLSIKYVVYRDATGAPVVDAGNAVSNVRAINQVWSQCNLGFQIDQYLAVRAVDYQLSYQTANMSELDEIRTTFEDSSSLLVVTTGPWDRSGTLGSTSANAWTSMPGSGPYGVVLERSVGTFANIIGHELGHYLNLLHVTDSTDLLNPIIYSNSTRLNQDQCNTARAAASFFWSKMYR